MSETETKDIHQQSTAATPAANGARSTPAAPKNDDLGQLRREEQAGALVMSARRAQRKGNSAEARKLLQQAFLIDPQDSSGLELLGDIFMEDGEQEKALRIFERGLKFHPSHRAFEEKIAICHVDLDEMRRDRDRRAQILEQGGIEPWMLLSAPRAFSLSAMLPGAGQLYIGQSSRAFPLFGATIVTFLGWSLPLYFGLKHASAQGVKGLGNGISAALGSMSGLGLVWFWSMIALWVGLYVYASVDAMMQAEKINELRKQGWDVIEE